MFVINTKLSARKDSARDSGNISKNAPRDVEHSVQAYPRPNDALEKPKIFPMLRLDSIF